MKSLLKAQAVFLLLSIFTSIVSQSKKKMPSDGTKIIQQIQNKTRDDATNDKKEVINPNGVESKTFNHLGLFDRKKMTREESKGLDRVFRQKYLNSFRNYHNIIDSNNTKSNHTNHNNHSESNLISYNNTSNVNNTAAHLLNIYNVHDATMDKIDEQTTNIIENLCASDSSVGKSLIQLKKEFLHLSGKIKIIEQSNYSKHKLIIKYTQIINHLNSGRGALIRLEDLIHTLKIYNCENYRQTYEKFKLVLNASNILIEKLNTVFKNRNLNMYLVILNVGRIKE